VFPLFQIESVSIVHVELQPSPLIVLESSHSSVACFLLSPQSGTQAVFAAFGEVPPVHTTQASEPVVEPPVQ